MQVNSTLSYGSGTVAYQELSVKNLAEARLGVAEGGRCPPKKLGGQVAVIRRSNQIGFLASASAFG